ncbi:translation initiation factor IF-5A [Candidatus Aenigmatarchaeota archaeon]
MEKRITEIKNLKSGSFVLIDGAPCVVDSLQVSKAGKHGAAKARIVVKGIFDKTKRNIVKPGGTKMDVPVIEKKTAQVLAFVGENIQLMDLEDYSTFEVKKPEFDVGEGDEVVIWKYGPNVMIKNKK